MDNHRKNGASGAKSVNGVLADIQFFRSAEFQGQENLPLCTSGLYRKSA